MSPGNSYFKDDEVENLLRETVQRYGKAAILVADIPAIATYLAYGYPENRARNKAIPKGNNLKNRAKRIAEELGIGEIVRIIDWEKEVEGNPDYQPVYTKIHTLYESNKEFAQAVDQTTIGVLESSNREIADITSATKIAIHYLLSELAFLEFAPKFLDASQVVYVYHRNWPVYERYVSGAYDGVAKSHLDFLLLEHSTETYRLFTGNEQMKRISSEGTLRCAFTNYPPGFIEDSVSGEFSGIFHDLLQKFSKETSWEIKWAEEVGYGVIQHGLNEGRYDLFAAPVWPIPERLSVAAFTEPIYFSEVGMWVREEDGEQSKKSEFLTNPFVRVAIKEGDITDSIAQSDYSAWRRVRVPQLTDTEELLRFVAQGDADVTFAEQFLVDEFNKHSPIKLINAAEKPIRVFPNCFMLSSQNTELQRMLNDFIKNELSNDSIKELLQNYVPNYTTQGINL